MDKIFVPAPISAIFLDTGLAGYYAFERAMLKKNLLPISAGILVLVCSLSLCVAWFLFHSPEPEENSPSVSVAATPESPDATLIQVACETIRSGCRLASFNMEEEVIPLVEPAPMHAPDSVFMCGSEVEAYIASHTKIANPTHAVAEKGPLTCNYAVFEGIFEKGDTLDKVLANLKPANSNDYVRAAKRVFSPKSYKPGQPWRAFIDPETRKLNRFEYEIDDARKLVVEGKDKPGARLEDLNFTVVLEKVDGVIKEDFFKTVSDIGENPQLAISLANIFGSEINFLRNLKPGDSFSVLVEKNFLNGEYRGYGRILAARFINGGKLHEAYLFRDEHGYAQYYNAHGENVRKTLLQSPLAVTRLSSRFSHSRLHPILNIARPHLGVDYAAPYGTPVKAVGNGTISEIGWGGGYGNMIVVRHSGELESLYAHLSGFAKGMAPNQKVRQGQVIGYVGSTGLATGPHLDFRLRQNGQFINPEKVVNPRSAPVPQSLKKEFEKVLAMERLALDGDRNFENYSAESIIAPALASFDEPPEEEFAAPARNPRYMGWRRFLFARQMAARKAFAKRRALLQKSAEHKDGRNFNGRKKQKKGR